MTILRAPHIPHDPFPYGPAQQCFIFLTMSNDETTVSESMERSEGGPTVATEAGGGWRCGEATGAPPRSRAAGGARATELPRKMNTVEEGHDEDAVDRA
jgi:hypothetical protein